jgi:serine/threonine-protein kinase
LAPFVPASGVLVARRYLLRARIGSGGMGEVWEAEDRELEGPCAVKFILNGSMLPERDARTRFTREAKVAARLRSPHAVQILGVGEHDGSPYLAMELLEGESLHGVLARVRRLDAETTLGIVSQIAAVLEKARELDIVHRDLKPDNVWLCAQRDLFVKVFDFGIAKTRLATLQTISGAVVGTPHYMSPEQVQGGRFVDHRTDLWALAVLTIECLTGQRPFESEALGGLVLKIMAGPGAELRERLSRVSPGFGAWAERALALEPGQRFQSATELVDALRSELLPGTRGPSGTQILHSLPRVPIAVPTPAGARTPSRPSSPSEPAASPSVAGTLAATSAAGISSVGAARTSEWSASPPSRTEQIPPVARSQHRSGRGKRWRRLGAVALAVALVALAVNRLRSSADAGAPVLPAAAASAAAPAALVASAGLDATELTSLPPVQVVPAAEATPQDATPPTAPTPSAAATPPAVADRAAIPHVPAPTSTSTPPPRVAAVRSTPKPSQVRAGLRPAPAPARQGDRPAEPARSPASYATNPGSERRSSPAAQNEPETSIRAPERVGSRLARATFGGGGSDGAFASSSQSAYAPATAATPKLTVATLP